MAYSLGVDLGTTFVAAAIKRSGRTEVVTLGDRSAAVPSVVLLRSDGTMLTGDAADRRAATEPERVAREFKRRLGDPTPLMLGGAPHSAASLLAHLLRAVVDSVSETEGEPPERITLTHPANWGPYKRELFNQVPQLAGLDGAGMVTEPEAAAAYYASTERLAEGAVVAVYDLGGGTFDATVLRKRAAGFEILGTPEGVEGLGGIDFDEAVYAHVNQVLDGALSMVDRADSRTAAALVRLRRDCVLAKEALSADTETSIPVLLPSLQTEVRLTRAEFEDMVRSPVEATIQSVRRALRSANVEPGDLSAVLLVGGSSRIPLVSQLVSAELGRPTAVDAHPKYAVALGAAALTEAGLADTATERRNGASAVAPMAMAAAPTEQSGGGGSSGVTEPKASDGTEPKASDGTEPKASDTTEPKAGAGNGAAPTTPGTRAAPALGMAMTPAGTAGTATGGASTGTGGAAPDGEDGKAGAGAPPPPLTRQRTNPLRPRGWKTILLVAACLVALAGIAFGVKVWAPSLVGNTVPAPPKVAPPVAPAPADVGGNTVDENSGNTGNSGEVNDNSGADTGGQTDSGTGNTGGAPQGGTGETPGQGGTVAPPTTETTTEPPSSQPNTNPGNQNPGGNTNPGTNPGDENAGGNTNPGNQNPQDGGANGTNPGNLNPLNPNEGGSSAPNSGP